MITEIESSTEHFKKLIKILGEEHLKTKVESPFDFIHISSEGVNADVIQNFRIYFNLSRELTADILDISAHPLQMGKIQ